MNDCLYTFVWLSRYLSPSERYNVEAHTLNNSSAKLDLANQFNEAVVSASLTQDTAAQNDWGDGLRSTASYVAATTTCDAPLMIPPSGYYETHEGKGSQGKSSQSKGLQGVRGSSVSTFAGELKVAHQARGRSGSSVWKGCTHDDGGGRGPSDEAEEGGWADYADERDQGNHSPCQETSSQQSEKDQRMWSALKTSLLSEGGDTDSSIVGFLMGKTDDGGTPDGGSDSNTFLKGTRDMEQLDLERSAMDRTMRPHRVASARLLETTQDSPTQTKVGSLQSGGHWLKQVTHVQYQGSGFEHLTLHNLGDLCHFLTAGETTPNVFSQRHAVSHTSA